ncbi:MAG: hypothetical protein RMJ98_12345, partial [Myxococcales bacterium]|nr:hypothetical protein [Polyangiaceae bacterium]MDW8250077.1 hypothetical protein [Myxococcales bacterium]
VWSESVGAWFLVKEELLRVSRDRDGMLLVLSYQEGEEEERASRRRAEARERAAEEQRRAAEERERAAQEQAERERTERLAAEEQRRAAEERERAAQEQALADAQQAVVDLCEVLRIDVTEERQTFLTTLDLAALRALRAQLKSTGCWPR